MYKLFFSLSITIVGLISQQFFNNNYTLYSFLTLRNTYLQRQIGDHPASFKGGEVGWKKYIQQYLDKNSNFLIENNAYGNCLISFIIMKDGKINTVRVEKSANSKLSKVAINALQTGPDWSPAINNGKSIASKKRVLISFRLSDNISNITVPK